MRIRRRVRSLRSAGGDARLRALDLALEGFFPEALSFQQLFFLGLASSWVQGLLPVQQLLEFFLWSPLLGMVAPAPFI